MAGFIKILIVLVILQMACTVTGIAQSSVLSRGKWFKIAVTADGIYRLDYSRLKQLGLEYPSHPEIYGNNQGQESYYNDGSASDDLKEIPVFLSGNNDSMEEGEYLLFYARGTSGWNFDAGSGSYSYRKHNYSDTAFYFITSGPGKGRIIQDAVSPSGPAGYTTSATDAFFVYEKDKVNFLKSGREWFERINDIDIDPHFENIISGEPIEFNLRAAARSSVSTAFDLYMGTELVANPGVPAVNLNDFTSTWAETTGVKGSVTAKAGTPLFRVVFRNNGDAGAAGYLDFLQLTARREAVFSGTSLMILDRHSVSPGRISAYTLKTETTDPVIWDVTDQYDIKNISYTGAGKDKTFLFRSDTLRSFMVFSPGKALVPIIKPEMIKNQDLHGSEPADLIIITHPLFRKYAGEIAAIHAGRRGLETLIVTQEEIFNEFSGGIPDICAIRNFVRMKYLAQRNSDRKLKYLLLLGDGSYENRTPPPGNPAYILTYQSQASTAPTSSFTSDDFFGLLEDGEGESEGTEDIGIGRLPVSDTTEAALLTGKIRNYTGPLSFGDWKNTVCLAADDEDGNTHLSDAEGLYRILHDSIPFINTKKIYLDAYRQETNAGGQTYPDVNKAINDMVNEGCLIFNYTGHGNESGLAHERVVTTGDIRSWKNGKRLPLFITATCEFSRFDDMDINVISGQMTARPSAGEMVLLNDEGGAIALMSTTRLVYSAPNYTLNKNIFNCIFDRDEKGRSLCLGDIIRIAKNKTGSGTNKRNFTLLGDPALELAWPWQGTVVTDSVCGSPASAGTDTLKALSVITLAGHIENRPGVTDKSFNGVVSLVVMDKEGKEKTLGNDGGGTVEFAVRKSVLFKGKTRAGEGLFRFVFIVPRDIDYSFGSGRLSYYASDGSSDMTGSFDDIIAGGFSGTIPGDAEGPVIKLYMNDTLFTEGGITDENPVLLARIGDPGGVNIAGTAPGHDLEGYLDDGKNDIVNLNGYFENDFDDYTKGSVAYRLGPLAAGKHKFTVRAWDNYNNSSQKTVIFTVTDEERFIVRGLKNYPNPFVYTTEITAGHNRPESLMDVRISIYRLDGSIVKVMSERVTASGYMLPPVTWDGTTDGGGKAGKGIYPYTVRITTNKGETVQVTGKMIIL